MRILITNDDGYQAGGLDFLKIYFTDRGHQVVIVSTENEKSGCSHGISIKEEIRLVKQYENVYVFRGTPADCVLVGVHEIMGNQVDVVVSGINHGRNVGKDIFYSGTVGAARQGAFYDIVSLALSLDLNGKPSQFDTVRMFLDQHFDTLVARAANKGFFYNINFPNIPVEELAGIRITTPSADYAYEQGLEKFVAPFQGTYYWVSSSRYTYSEDPRSDIWAIRNNYISISPLKLLPDIVEGFIL